MKQVKVEKEKFDAALGRMINARPIQLAELSRRKKKRKDQAKKFKT